MRGAALIGLLLLAGAARGEGPSVLPSDMQAGIAAFQSCLDVFSDRFEARLMRAATPAASDYPDALWTQNGPIWCGTLGIVACDRSAAPQPCQHALGAEMMRLNGVISAELTAPTRDMTAADALYQATHALAQGGSAGPDCAGASDVMEAWCVAHEGRNQLAVTLLAWQIARYLGHAEPALEAGWARPRAPVTPRPRPE